MFVVSVFFLSSWLFLSLSERPSIVCMFVCVCGRGTHAYRLWAKYLIRLHYYSIFVFNLNLLSLFACYIRIAFQFHFFSSFSSSLSSFHRSLCTPERNQTKQNGISNHVTFSIWTIFSISSYKRAHLLFLSQLLNCSVFQRKKSISY